MNRSYLIGGLFIVVYVYWMTIGGTIFVLFGRCMIISGIVYFLCSFSSAFSNNYIKTSLGLNLVYLITLPILIFLVNINQLVLFSSALLFIGIIKGFFNLSKPHSIVS